MLQVVGEASRIGASISPARLDSPLTNALRTAGPALLFGVRLWASVCLALYVAFWLQLDNAFWAGTSAAIVCQPQLGASLRKGWFRMIGTIVGAVAIVVLTACFPQDRAVFLVTLALWAAACALVGTLLRNFAAYSAALAGYTAAIIASDQLGATGGLDGQAFMLAITRASEICIGIVCAGIVLAGTDFGGAPRRLAALLEALSSEIMRRFSGLLARPGPELPETQPVRRELTRRVIALAPVIDQAIGESSRLRYRSPLLQEAVDGLFAALAGWRTVAARLERLPDQQALQEASAVVQSVPQELRSVLEREAHKSWLTEPAHLSAMCDAASRKLTSLSAGTPSLRLLADQTAKVLSGISNALNGLALLVADPARRLARGGVLLPRVPDWLPALVNAGRAFATICAVELFWIATAWPNGASGITFATINVVLLAFKADEAYASAVGFMVGTALAAVFAAIVEFAALPRLESFASFSLVLGLYLVPVGAMVAQPWQTALFTAMAVNFVPILGPANQMNYDPEQFYNAALAIVAGCGTAALSFRLMPPLSSAFRMRRLLTLALRDLRRLATAPTLQTPEAWEGRMYGRLAALPDQAKPLERARLVAALSVGTEIIQLRRMAIPLGLGAEVDSALEAFAQADSATATARLSRLDDVLASRPAGAESSLVVWARARILAIAEALARHASYFEEGASA